MKKFILSCAVACVATFACLNEAHAQDSQIRFGIKAGADLMTLGSATSNGISLNYSNRVGFQGGVYADVPLSENISFVPQVLFTQKGGNIKTSISAAGTTVTFDGKTQINYVDVPLLIAFKVQPNLSLFAGPQVAFFMSQKTTLNATDGTQTENESSTNSAEFKKVLVGGNIGVGYNFTENIGLNLHYIFDLQHAGTGDSDSGEKNRGFALSVSYLF